MAKSLKENQGENPGKIFDVAFHPVQFPGSWQDSFHCYPIVSKGEKLLPGLGFDYL